MEPLRGSTLRASIGFRGAIMTAPARITQADIDRATKAVKTAGLDHARIILRLEKSEIEIIIGESAPPPEAEEWSDDDV